MHMFLESSSASRMHTSNSSSVVATTTKSLNISKYDAFYLQVHNQIDSIKKFKLNTDLNYKEKEEQLIEFKKVNENLSESYSRLKSENERLKASLEQNEMFKNESFNKIETLQNALKLIRDYMKQIDKRIESYEQTNKIYAKDNETKLKLIDDLKLKFQMQTDDLKEKIIEFESTNQALLDQTNCLESDLNIKNKVINDYESRIKQLESNESQCQQAITQLESSIQTEKAALNNQIQISIDLETKFNQLKREHEDELQAKANLMNEFNENKAEFQTQQQQNSDLNQQIKELKIEIKALNDSISEEKQSKSQLISDLDDYKLKFQNQQDLNQHLNKDIEDLNEKFITEKNDLESKLTKDLNELKNSFDNISLKNGDLTKRLEETQIEISKLIEDNKCIENNLNEHKTLLIKQKEEVVVQTEINSCLIDELNKTRQQVTDKTSLANKLAQSIEELNKKHEESITNFKIEFEIKLNDETSQLNVKHNELFEQLATFLLDGLVEKDDKLQELLTFNEQLSTKQNLELTDLSNRFKKETDAKIANLKEKLNKEQSKIDQLNDDNKSLKYDLKQTNNQIKELSNEIESQKKTVQKQAAENKSLTQSKQKQEDGFQCKIKDLNAKIEQLKADLKNKTEEIKSAKKDHSHAIANLNSILDEAKNELKKVQNELKNLETANLKLQTDLDQSKKIETSPLTEIKRVPKRPREDVSSDEIDSITSSDYQAQAIYQDSKVIIKDSREKVHIAAIKVSILDEIEKSKNDSNQKFLLTTKPQRAVKNRYESVIKSSTPTKRLVPLDSLRMSAIKKKEQHGLANHL